MKKPASTRTLAIELSHEDAEALEAAIPSMMEAYTMTRDQVMSRALILGMVMLQQNTIQTFKRERCKNEGIRKLKASEYVLPEELEAINAAARSGDLESIIIVNDFKRFGRLIAKD